MVDAMCTKVVDSSQDVCYPIHPASTSSSNLKPFLSTNYTFPPSAGVFSPCLPPAPNKATETFIFLFGIMFAPGICSSSSSRKQHQAGRCKQAGKQQQPSSSNQCMALETKIRLFPGARPPNNEIIQLQKVVVMPKLNFFHAHGLPIRL